MSKCKCRVCRRTRKFEAILRKYNMAQEDFDFMSDVLLALLTAELDRDWALAELKAKTKTEKEQTNESTEK